MSEQLESSLSYISPSSAATDLFSNGGEMGELMRAFDWGSTSIGAIERWPQSLRLALGILLRSRHPMFLWWGPDLIQFYNDGYRPSLGVDKHPQALGEAGRECWAEIWPTIGPLVEGVLAGGESVWNEDQFIPITRNGFLEEVYWTYSYSGVLDEDGAVGGVMVVCSETTRRIRAERRLRSLGDLTGDVIKAKTLAEVTSIAAHVIADNADDLPFALLYHLTPDGTQLQLAKAVNIEADTPASPIALNVVDVMAHSVEGWYMGEVLETGQAYFVDDSGSHFGPLPGGRWDRPSTKALVLPIRQPGQEHPGSIFVAGISPGQIFDASYRRFLDMMADALATAMANAHAHQDAMDRARDLAELDRAKTIFFSNVSHEFRTPLTLLLGPIEDLLSVSDEPLTARQRVQLEVVQRNGLRLFKLVNALLDVSRIEAGRLYASYHPTDLAGLTRELANAFQGAMAQAGLTLLVDCSLLPEPIFVDQEMWEKIVLNLLSNAFKFTLSGQIYVAVHLIDDVVELIVRDTGVGISANAMPHLFERFYRFVPTHARTQEGSGIGLSLVQELVRLHGGTISVQSTEGVGSTFTVRLPRGSGHLPAEHVASARLLPDAPQLSADLYVDEALHWLPTQFQTAQEVSLSSWSTILPDGKEHAKYHILVVDDNADMQDYLMSLLAPLYHVSHCSDGSMALTFAKRERPDLILTDVVMPGLDGFALLHALRGDALTRAIPTILLSARAGEEAVLEALQAGADDYLVKPFSVRELLARIQSRLEIASLRREAESARQRLYDLFEQAPAVICILSGPQHVYELANPLYHQIVGRQNLIGKPIREALPELAGQGIYELLDTVYQTGEPYIGNEVALHFDNQPEEVFFNFVYQPFRSTAGVIEGILVHAVDTTTQVRARQRMDTFLGIASHELRTPLTSIKGNVQLAKRSLAHVLRDIKGSDVITRERMTQIHTMLERAERQINFENRLVSDLVDTARIQAEKLEFRFTATDIFPLIYQMVEENRLMAPDRTIELFLPSKASPVLSIDTDRVAQVVSNYLTNALKYSAADAPVMIQVELLSTQLRVSVTDRGPGLTEEQGSKIWQRFYRVPGVEVQSGSGVGLGLGLHICWTIIEQHGGQVGVDSQKGAGSTFWFTLPLPNPS